MYTKNGQLGVEKGNNAVTADTVMTWAEEA